MGVYAVLLDRSAQLRGLTDPAGGTFDAAGDFDRLLGEDGPLSVWSSIDLYGDTTLTTEQVEALLSELPDVIARSMEGAARPSTPRRHGSRLPLRQQPHAAVRRRLTAAISAGSVPAVDAAPVEAVTLRSPWLLCCWLLGLGGVLVGLATASSGDAVGLLLGGAVAAGSGWVVVRVPFMRVQATAAGLTNHGLFRQRRVPVQDVLSIDVEQTDDKVVWQVYAPVVKLRDDGEVVLQQLSGYSTSKRVGQGRVGRQTDWLRRALSGGLTRRYLPAAPGEGADTVGR